MQFATPSSMLLIANYPQKFAQHATTGSMELACTNGSDRPATTHARYAVAKSHLEDNVQ